MRRGRTRRGRSGRLGGIALAALLAGCGSGPDPVEEAAPARPADRPLLTAEQIDVEEVLRLSDERLVAPRDLAVDEAGNVYVLDVGEPNRILKFDSSGAYALTFGERDQERDRIASALEMSLAPWNTLLVVDRGNNTLLTYLTLGTFASSVGLDPGVGLDVEAMPGFGEFYLHKWVPDQRRSVVLRMRVPYDSLGTTYEVRIPHGLSVRREARGIHYHTAVDRRGNLLVGFYDGYPIRVLAPNGETRSVIDLDRAPMPKDPAEIRAEAERNLEILTEQAPDVDPAVLEEAAQPDSVHPIIEEIVVDDRDRVWVRTNRPETTGATPYDVFNEAGELLARVEVPGAVRRTALGPEGRLYVIASEGSNDERASVVGYDVRLGGGEDASPPPPPADQPTSVSETSRVVVAPDSRSSTSTVSR